LFHCVEAGNVKLTPTIVIDTREQSPLVFSSLPTVIGTLQTADYSVLHLERIIAVERKSLPDLLACVTGERDRFDRELQRLLAYRFRLLVIEATQKQIEAGKWRSQVLPASVMGSLAAWSARFGLPVWLAGDHAGAAVYVEKYLYQCAKTVATELVHVASFADCVTVGRKRKQADDEPPVPDESEVAE
jgi:DNA excision repair protein ERCC-4